MKLILPRKYFLSVLLLSFFLTLGCSENKEPEVLQPEAENTVTLRFGHDMPKTSSHHAAAERFAQLVATRSGGRVNIDIYPGQTLGTDYEMIEMARAGTLDIILPPTAKLSTMVPSIQVIDLPYLFNSRKVAHRVLDSLAGDALLKKLSDFGLYGVAFWESGFKQLTTDRPINQYDDLHGMKFRIMRSEVLRDQFRAWGSDSIAIDFGKTTEALADGVVNGQENPLGSIYNMKFHEVQKELLLSNHGYLSQVFAFSNKSFNALPEDIKEILLKTVEDVTPFQRDETLKLENKYLEKIKESGIRVSELSPTVSNKLQEKSRLVLEKHRLLFGTDIVEKILQEIDETREYNNQELIIALDADMAGNSALSGLAIRRGIEIAIQEINADGGVLGKKLSLIARDNSMVSARGINNLEHFSKIRNLVAVVGGISSPVVLSELDLIHKNKLLFLVPWAAATPIVDNGRKPNYVFRVSVRDEYAGGFLLTSALGVSKKVGVLLVNNGWGRSNYTAISDEMKKMNMQLTSEQWFDWGEVRLNEKIDSIINSGAEVIIYVGNPVEGTKLVKDMVARDKRIPIISHWGVAGSDFSQMTDGDVNDIDFRVLQTFSFIGNDDKKVSNVIDKYRELYGINTADEIVAPAGTAHAYDLVHMLAIAIEKAGVSDMQSIRNAMEEIGAYEGIVRSYQRPFDTSDHDALAESDYFLAEYQNGVLVRKTK